MSGLQIMVTAAGRQEIINAENTGTTPVLIAEIGLGTGKYDPSESQTALQAEFKRLTTVAGDLIADDTIHVSAVDDSSDEYSYSEFGLYTDSGTLFAVYSQQTDITTKSAQGNMLLSADVVLTRVNATSLTFGDASFTNPPASETVKGVLELSDPTEAQELTDDTTGMTPAKVATALAQFGIGIGDKRVTISNANQALNNGWYYSTDNANHPVDAPGYIFVERNDANNYVQHFVRGTGAAEEASYFKRRCVAGVIGAWKEIYHSGNLPAFLLPQWGQLSDSFTINAPIDLTAAHLNKFFPVINADPITLPPSADVRPGSTLGFVNGGVAPVTIQCHGTDTIAVKSTGITEFTLENGDFCRLVMSDQNKWRVISGSSLLGNSGAFAFSFASSGYQKLPSGLIVQWGAVANGDLTFGDLVTFPITFPDSVLSLTATAQNQNNFSGIELAYVGSITRSSFRIYTQVQAELGGRWQNDVVPASWLAIGF